MQFSHLWTRCGVVTRYIGEASIGSLVQSMTQRDSDARMKAVDFLLVDALEVTAAEMHLSSSHVLARNSNSVWTANPGLHVLMVNQSDVVAALMDAYRAYMKVVCCPWIFSKYSGLEAAVAVVNELYEAELSCSEIRHGFEAMDALEVLHKP